MRIGFKRVALLSVAGLVTAVAAPLAGSPLASPVSLADGPAASPVAFTIPAEDGYGIAECMAGGDSCGQTMANAMCEAHGHHKAVAFGAADVTGSVGKAATASPDEGAVMIRCAD